MYKVRIRKASISEMRDMKNGPIEKSFTCPICKYSFKKINGVWFTFDSVGKMYPEGTEHDEGLEKRACPIHGVVKEE